LEVLKIIHSASICCAWHFTNSLWAALQDFQLLVDSRRTHAPPFNPASPPDPVKVEVFLGVKEAFSPL